MRPSESTFIGDRRGAPVISNRPVTNRMRKPIVDVTPRSVPSNVQISVPLYQHIAASPLAIGHEIQNITEAILSASQGRPTDYNRLCEQLENEIMNLIEFAVNGDPFSVTKEKLEEGTTQLTSAVRALTIVRLAWNYEAQTHGTDMGLAIEVAG